jgi:hypothetical protein
MTRGCLLVLVYTVIDMCMKLDFLSLFLGSGRVWFGFLVKYNPIGFSFSFDCCVKSLKIL